MSWLDNLKRTVSNAVVNNPVIRTITQSTPVRMAGRALESSYVRPMIGFKPEIAGIVASEFLPKESPVKAILDAGLYLASGPFNTTLGLAGSTPQGDTPTSNWRALGYSSEQDMKNRIAAQMQKDAAAQAREAVLKNRLPGVYIADDYGPPRPVRYQDGGLMIGDYAVTRFDTQAQRELSAGQPQRDATAPASTRPVEEKRPPVSPTIPTNNTPPPQQTAASMNELAQLYARQRRLGSAMAEGGELQRRLYEGGAAEGMPVDKFMSWVEAHPDLAYRLAEKRGLLPEPI